jgi:peptide methionine sulfoxide reductase msrA/msrB
VLAVARERARAWCAAREMQRCNPCRSARILSGVTNVRSLGLLTALLLACSSAHSEGALPAVPARATAPAPPQEGEAVAYFAGGCFWGVEHFLEQLDGVLAVESGYMGGHVDSPSYEQVSSQTSGHLETVRVRFDPARVTYEQVTKRFFEIHDPTQANGQGPDIGPEYLSAVFFVDDAQKRTTEGLIAKLRARGYDVVTEVRPAEQFWAAEDYHQDYYARTGKYPYCHARVKRFGD